jgi:hypothetical protein
MTGDGKPKNETTPRLREKVVNCLVCGRHTLRGYFADLAAGQVGYNEFFLPVPIASTKIEGGEALANLTLLDNYVCPHDLYVYVGKIAIVDTPSGAEYEFTRNHFHRAHINFKPDTEQVVAGRLTFFFQALLRSGSAPPPPKPTDDNLRRTEKIVRLTKGLYEVCSELKPDENAAYKAFVTMTEELRWNPLESLLEKFFQDRAVAGAVMELQLADLIYRHRRDAEKRRERVAYSDLYRALDRYRNLAVSGGSLDDYLAGNILLQCLKMAAHFTDSRRHALLQAAFDVSSFQVRVKSRLGADMNQDLDVVAANPDVMMYLNVRLGRELGVTNPHEEGAVRLLHRRLRTVGDYQFASSTQESARAERIGGFLKTFVADL